MVLSQPPISTTASSGSARTISSTSMAMRLRSSIEVGNENASCSEMVGNTNGSPPPMRTPRATASATCGAVLWQGLKSEAVESTPDDRAFERVVGEAGALEEAAAQKQRELFVTVLGETGAQASLQRERTEDRRREKTDRPSSVFCLVHVVK